MFGAGSRCASASIRVATGIAFCDDSGLGIGLGFGAVSLGANRGLGGGRDTGGGVGAGARGSAGWAEILDPSLLLLGSGTGSGCSESLTLTTAFSRRSSMDLSKINSMAAVRCEFSPDEVLRMILESKLSSTEGFSSDWKNSCSISLIRLWLVIDPVNGVDRCELWNGLLRSEGGE